MWRRYLSAGTNLTSISTLGELDALTRPAILIMSAAVADVEESEGCLNSGFAVPDDEEVWTMGDLVEVDSEERVGVERYLRDSQESCCVKRWKVLEIVVEAVGLDVEQFSDAVVT